MDIGTVAQWASAVATTLAVLVALFKEEISRLWRAPELTLAVRLRAPDCVKTPIFVSEIVQGRVLQSGRSFECYYFRLWVKNVGKQRADRVQVYAAKLLKRHADTVFRDVQNFQPMNLRWAHSPDPLHPIIFDDVNPKMGKHCDLGRIVDPKARVEAGVDQLDGVPNGKTVFHFDTEVEPGAGSHLIPPGVYQLHLKIAAANAEPIEKRLEITLPGEWFSDETKMFADGVGIRELN